MPGFVGTPTLAKMSIDAVGRLWRRLKKSKKSAPEQASEQGPQQQGPQQQGSEHGSEQDLHAFYSDTSESFEHISINSLDTLEYAETIQTWINGNTDTYDFFGAWRHPSEPSSIYSFDDEVDLGYRGVYVRGDPTEPFDVIEPTLPTEAIVPAKPAKRGIKSVFKNVKAVFKQRNNSG